jgi:hypothetical protein
MTAGGLKKWRVTCFGSAQYEQRWAPRQALCLTVHFLLQLLLFLVSHGVANLRIGVRGSIPGRRSGQMWG